MRFYARLGCGLIILGTSLAAHSQSSAADWRLIRKPQSAAAPTTIAEPGQVTYLRGLVRDANAAAERGENDEARRFAERAYQVSVSYQAILRDMPDCSPETMAALAQRYGSTIGLARTRTSAQPSSPPPKLTAANSEPPPDLLTLVEARFRKVSQTRTEPPAVRTANSASPNGASKSTPAEWKPVASQAPATPAQTVSTTQTLFDQPFRRNSSHRTSTPRHRAPAAATPAGGRVNDPAVTSAIGGEIDVDNLELYTGEDSAAPAETPIPPAPPVTDDVEASAIAAPANSRTAAWSREETRLQDDNAAEAATEDSLTLTASSMSQPIDQPGPQSDVTSDGESAELLNATNSSSVANTRPAAAACEHADTQPPVDAGRSAPAGVVQSLSRMAGVAWQSEFGERVALALCVAMLIGGVALFGLSFRWT